MENRQKQDAASRGATHGLSLATALTVVWLAACGVTAEQPQLTWLEIHSTRELTEPDAVDTPLPRDTDTQPGEIPAGSDGDGEALEPDRTWIDQVPPDHGPEAAADADLADQTVFVCSTDEQCGEQLDVPACMRALCQRETGTCALLAAPDGELCDDGSACTYGDLCQNGACSGTALPCQDDNPCTDDWCHPFNGCQHTDNSAPCDDGDPCSLDDICVAQICQGTPDPRCLCATTLDCLQYDDENQCNGTLRCRDGYCHLDPATVVVCPPATQTCTLSFCQPSTGQCADGPAPSGTPCDDESQCTAGDHCDSGQCLGTEIACSDDDECTEDRCQQDIGCVFVPTVPVQCDDVNDCTLDDCIPRVGCTHVALDDGAVCNDGNACTDGDVCVNATCSGIRRDCDDDQICTVDACDADGECVHTTEAAACDDHNDCTSDSCTEPTGCQHTPIAGGCDDGNPCTLADQCIDGTCMGEILTCDDDDVCTDDSCTLGICQHLFNAAPCDDRVACSVDDHCESGQCVGNAASCPPCIAQFDGDFVRLNSLQLGNDGNPGQGLDVDGQATTCAPPDLCSEGIDNAMAPLASFLNGLLDESVVAGELNDLLEFVDTSVDGPPFVLNVYTNAQSTEASCDVQQDICEYEISAFDLDAQCHARESFSNAVIHGDLLTAGGSGFRLALRWSLGPAAMISVTLHDARIAGQVVLDPQGGGNAMRVVGLSGLFGGWIERDELEAALLGLPPETLPIDPQYLVQLMRTTIVSDIDGDGDGAAEGLSIGIPINAIEARVAAQPCQPACAGNDCGPDGCGGACGYCALGQTCQEGACIVESGTDSCLQVFQCARACTEGDDACVAACVSDGRATAQDTFNALLDCAVQHGCTIHQELCVASGCNTELTACSNE